MRATATPLEENHVQLTVEVDESEVAAAIDRTAAQLARQVNIKGFRKGKVPKNVLIAHLGGAQALRAEAIKEAVPDYYALAVADTLIDPIAQPSITVTAGEESGELVFEANVEVRPEVEVSGYDALRVTIPSPLVTDEEVQSQIDRMRETDATLAEVDRPIVTGDLVTMRVKITRIGEEGEPLEMDDFMYPVGSKSLTDGVDELILGLRAGETLSLNAPSAQGSGTSTYELTLKKVSERVLPELTDEWVAENTEWASVEEYREQVTDLLRRRKVIEAQFSQRDALLVAVSDLVPESAVPESLVNDETNERVHELGHRLEQQRLNLETFLQVTNQTTETLLESLRADAVRGVRIDLALRAVARAEGLEATDEEVDEELAKTAESMGETVERLRDNLRDTGRTVTFRAEVDKMKASRWLREHVTYVDPLGVPIDPDLLQADQSDETPA